MLIFLLILVHESVYICDHSYPAEKKSTLISYAVYLRLKLHTRSNSHYKIHCLKLNVLKEMAPDILIIKPTTCTNFSNLFWNRTLHVSDRFSVHHQESSTVYIVIGIRHTDCADC